MLLDVVRVQPGDDYQLELEFENGEKRVFDMRPLLSLKPYDRIAAPHMYRRAKVEYGTVVWPGEIDIAPETLYDRSLPM